MITPEQEVTLDLVRMLGRHLTDAVCAKDRLRADKVINELRELVAIKVPHLEALAPAEKKDPTV